MPVLNTWLTREVGEKRRVGVDEAAVKRSRTVPFDEMLSV